MREFLVALAVGLTLLGVDAARLARGRTWAPRHAGTLKEAERAVGTYLAATRALEESGGDVRLAERVPAGPELVAEGQAGQAFAERRLGLTERHELVRLEVTGSRWLAAGGAEVRTREFWIHRAVTRDGSGETIAPVSNVCEVRYDVARDGAAWRVVDDRLYPPPPGED